MLRPETIVFSLGFIIASTTGSALHGSCTSNEECGTFDTYCKNNTCVCKDHFAVMYDTCIHLSHPVRSCSKKSDCHAIPRSICRESRCACKPFHHLFEGQCVKSRGLDEMCELNHQCYCGKNCEDKIECFDSFCRCKPGYRQHSRRCIATENLLPPRVSLEHLDNPMSKATQGPRVSLESLDNSTTKKATQDPRLSLGPLDNSTSKMTTQRSLLILLFIVIFVRFI